VELTEQNEDLIQANGLQDNFDAYCRNKFELTNLEKYIENEAAMIFKFDFLL
jgi:hypothetical protein